MLWVLIRQCGGDNIQLITVYIALDKMGFFLFVLFFSILWY